MPRRNLRIFLLAFVICLACYFRGTRSRYAPTLADAMGVISENYIEPIDRRALYEDAMVGMLGNLDKYSAYIPPLDYDQLQEELDQKFAGVGIEVGIDPDTQRLMVLSPIVNSPAFRAKLLAGDLIMSIDGKDTQGMELKESVDLMRGFPGTTVSFEILSLGSDQTRPVQVERASIQIKSVLGDSRNADGTWNYTLAEHPDIAYLRLVSFGEATSTEVAKALGPLANKTRGAILDLRGNPGGLLTAAVGVCDLFLDACRVVSVRRRSGFSKPGKAEATARDAIIADTYESTSSLTFPKSFPVVILIDKYSASASEIVSACLQDYKRAVVVGQRSWGKGTVQNVFNLEGGRSAMKITTATYWRPSNKNIHRFSTDTETDDWGVKPDEGFEIVYTDDDMIRRFRDRRQRDFVPAVRKAQIKTPTEIPGKDELTDGTPDDPESNGKDTTAPDSDSSDQRIEKDENSGEDSQPKTKLQDDDEPFDDTQLQRAVEYLESLGAETSTRRAA